jgi:hypothetical protein
MTRDEGIARIREQLAFKQTLTSTIISNMQLAQIQLQSLPTLPWFLTSEDSYATTTASEERILLPSNFLQEAEDARVYYRPDDWPDEDEVELKKEDYDQLKRDFLGVEDGPPQAYALLGGYFRIFPLPDAVYTLRMIYMKEDEVLDTNIENGWLKYNPLLLLGTTLKLVSKGPIRDVVADGIADQWITIGMKVNNDKDASRAMTNREDQIGGRHW